ncbi:MAG: hypothetical protein WC358_06565 [Ignavibacteria bacterium]|jgi:hypothetical protein
MKNFLKVLSVVLIPVLFYLFMGFFSSSEEKTANKKNVNASLTPTPIQQKDFLHFIFNYHYNPYNTTQWVENNLTRYNELNYNALHIFGGFDRNLIETPELMGSDRYGKFGPVLSQTQIENTEDLMDNMYRAGLKGIFGRIKIELLCYGQRLTYEVPPTDNNTTINNGFCYRNIMSEDIYTEDEGRTVLHPVAGQQSAGNICQNIYENLQHSDVIDYLFNSTGTWYLKPVMKINISNPNPTDDREVARIEVRKFNGDILETKIIRVRDFGENYNGLDYIDSYDFRYEPPGTNLRISGSTTNGLNFGRAPSYTDPFTFKNNCHVDFKIYWSGLVDVWFDKLIVDDQLGNDVLSGVYDNDNIPQEVLNFASHQDNLTFFADEVKYSNYDCINHVLSVMKQYNPNAELVCVANPTCCNFGLRNNADIFNLYLHSVNWKRMMVDLYQIFAEAGTVPDNLTNCDPRVPQSWKANKQTYNNWLQNKTFGQKTFEPNNTYYNILFYI